MMVRVMTEYCVECKQRCNRRMTKEDVLKESKTSFALCVFCDFATYVQKEDKKERYGGM